MIKCETFEHDYQVVNFCNENHITKENIISLLFNSELLFSYRLFYEVNNWLLAENLL